MTTLSSVNSVILIDKRVFNYQVIIDSLRDDVRYILYDVYDQRYDTMVDYIKAKISELNVASFTTVGIVEYNTNRNYYRLFGESSPDALITSVIWTDPSLQTWSYINDFIVWLKSTYMVQYFDFLACSLYINMSWKYIIDTLSTTTGVQIRASTDKTGSSTLGGDWILESTGTDIDMRDIYFNQTIENFDGVLDIGAFVTNTIPDPLDPSTPTHPSYNGGSGEFLWPRYCKIYNNSLFVVDEQNYRVQIFDLSLNYIARISYNLPVTDFALNTTNGRYYILAHTRLTGYNSDNTVLFQLSSDLAFPRSITLDSSGNIYVSLGNRIRKFNPLGTSLGDFMNSAGSGNGQINNATTIVFDSSGDFWITDEGPWQSTLNHRVQKFTSTGTFLMTFGSGGTGNGQFRTPTGLGFDSSGNVYVGDYQNDRVQVFNSSGTFLRIIGTSGGGVNYSNRHANGDLDGPMGVAVDTNNNVYVVENINQRVQKFNSYGTYVAKVGFLTNINSSATGAFNTPLDVQMFPSNGNFYVVESANHRVQKFNSSRVFVLSFGSLGSENSQFNTPQRLAIDSNENIYVSDMNNHVVKVFNSSGTYIRRVGTGTSGSATGQFNSPRGVAIDSATNLYVTDNNTRIQKFDSSGTFIASYTIVENAWGIAIDTNGNMYVTGVATVYKYSSSGSLLITMTNSNPWNVGINVRGISVDPLTNNFAIVNQSSVPFLKIYNSSGTRLLASNATTTTSSGGSVGVSVAASGIFYYNNIIFISQEQGAVVYKLSVETLLLTPSLTTSTFTVPSLKTGSDAPSFAITTSPTSNSPATITYTSNNTSIATIAADGSGNAITIVGAGIVTFTASQAATASYYAASQTSNALIVIRATPTLAFVSPPPTTKNITDASFSVVASSTSSGAVTYSSSNTSFATVGASTGVVTLKGAGTVTITASQASTALNESPTDATCSIVISSAGTALQGQTVSSGTSYASLDLSGASLVGTTVSGVSFSGANLSNVNFSGAVITNTDFTNANISGATNLPTFSTIQKLQLLKNINNAGVSAVQVATTVAGSVIYSLLASPESIVASATFTIKSPTTVDASANKVVTVTSLDISGGKSVYIPMNVNETVKINNVVYSFNGTNILDASGNIVTYAFFVGAPFKIYAGSMVAVNIQDALNKITISGDGLYNILSSIFALKT